MRDWRARPASAARGCSEAVFGDIDLQAHRDWLEPAALFYLHGQVEAGSLCPATMTQAAWHCGSWAA